MRSPSAEGEDSGDAVDAADAADAAVAADTPDEAGAPAPAAPAGAADVRLPVPDIPADGGLVRSARSGQLAVEKRGPPRSKLGATRTSGCDGARRAVLP